MGERVPRGGRLLACSAPLPRTDAALIRIRKTSANVCERETSRKSVVAGSDKTWLVTGGVEIIVGLKRDGKKRNVSIRREYFF